MNCISQKINFEKFEQEMNVRINAKDKFALIFQIKTIQHKKWLEPWAKLFFLFLVFFTGFNQPYLSQTVLENLRWVLGQIPPGDYAQIIC